MGKKKAGGEVQPLAHVDSMFADDRAFWKTNHNNPDAIVGTELKNLTVGLPLPGIGLKYLLGTNVWPLGRIVIVVGMPGSLKSSFLYETMRWHRVYGGGGVLLESETKDSTILRTSIIGEEKAVQYHECHSVEDWQDGLTKRIRNFTEYCDQAGGPGRTIPICFGIDSLSGKATREQIDKVLKDGHASRGYSVSALYINEYLKVISGELSQKPFSIVITNHLKPGVDFMGRPTRNISGGYAPKFQESLEIEMQKTGNKENLQESWVTTNMKVQKSSMGQGFRSLKGVRMLWWWDDNHQQHTSFLWGEASVKLLTTTGKDGAIPKTMLDKCREYVYIREARGQGLYWCEELDIPKDDPQSAELVGQALAQRPELERMLHAPLHITEYPIFQPALDFRQQLAAVKEQAQAQEAAADAAAIAEAQESEDD